MSPILVRPVREQLEHDRVIRLLQAKYKRKFDVGINPGAEQGAPLGAGSASVFPDLILQSPDRGRRLAGVVEVETGESVNNLEAMSQWASFARLRAPFHLYVPAGSIETARRLCADLQIPVAELWTYHPMGDQMRFMLVQRSQVVPEPKPPRPPVREPVKAVLRPPAPSPPPPPSRPVRRAAPPAPTPARRKAAAKSVRGRTATKAAPARSRAKKTAPIKTARAQKRK